jgi:hypothetical protein
MHSSTRGAVDDLFLGTRVIFQYDSRKGEAWSVTLKFPPVVMGLF